MKTDIETLKNEGNQAFNNNNLHEAIKIYTTAIKSLENQNTQEKAIILKNRAAAHLKLKQLNETIDDCTACLEIIKNDPKALYRRCQALEKLERYEEAYRDAQQIYQNDPNNKTIQKTLEQLYEITQERAKKNAQLQTKLDAMYDIAFNPKQNLDKRQIAMNNLLVLARQHAAAAILIQQKFYPKTLKNFLKTEKNLDKLIIISLQILGELLKYEYLPLILATLPIEWFLDNIDTKQDEQINAIEYCIQLIINKLSGMKNNEKPIKELMESNQDTIDHIFRKLVQQIDNRCLNGASRDTIIKILIRNIDYKSLNWCEKFVDTNGIKKLLICLSELEEISIESSLIITKSTHTLITICLTKIYDNMYYDQARQKFLNEIQKFITEMLVTPDIESKIRVTNAITSLLRGPLDVGNTVISKDGIIEMILVMATSDDLLQQKIACECIIAAASKSDKAKTIIIQGVHILKQLYQSKDDGIRARALVGLCKLASSGGNDVTMRPFDDDANLKLWQACRKYLVTFTKTKDLRRWAVEGLAYLTLDADVKEQLINDDLVIKSIINLANLNDQSSIFGIITTIVNLTNSYDKQTILPEMLELAKFTKQHIPEEHPYDDQEFVDKRLGILAKSGITTALVALSQTESVNMKELIGRVFNALASQSELRGMIVQQGGVKALIRLATGDGTEKGKRCGAQALARIAITMNPEVAFPGQRVLEIIRPIIQLLHPDCDGLENFEALLALCNIAQIDETARKRIINDGGLSKIEHYMYEDHLYLSRAAVQCITNLTMSPDVVGIYEGANDRIKYLLSICLDDDLDTVMAAGGALAILTSSSEKCCLKIFDSTNWLDCIHCLLANQSVNIQYRGVCIVRNMIDLSEKCTLNLMESDIMEILMALTKYDKNDDKKQIVEIAMDALQLAERWGVIKKAK